MIVPTISQFGDVVVALFAGTRIVFEFSRLREHHDSLTAEIMVSNEVGELYGCRLNLMAPGGRRDVLKALEEVHPIEGWRAMLDGACQGVVRHLRQGEPAIALVPTPPSADQWLVAPWWPLGQITALYGAGGSAKSLLALALGVSGILQHRLGLPWVVAPIRKMLYLDWESTKETHEARLWGLCHTLEFPPPGSILYRRVRRPLTDLIVDIRTEAHREQVDYIVLDSLIPASGLEPEGADASARTLQALDSLPGSKTAVGHSPKGDAEKAQGSLFGSVMNTNLSRSAIEVRRHESIEESETHVSVYHRKTNNGPTASPVAIRLTFAPDGTITLDPAKPEARGGGLGRQILEALKSGRQTVTALAERLDVEPASVRTTLNRLASHGNHNKVLRFERSEGGKGKETQWGLRDANHNTIGG